VYLPAPKYTFNLNPILSNDIIWTPKNQRRIQGGGAIGAKPPPWTSEIY